MENKLKKALNNFVEDNNEFEFQQKVEADKKKFIRTDKSLIERFDRIVVDERGRQLLREQY